MFSELDIVTLNHDLIEHNLKKGAVGTILQVYEKGKAYEVEFVNNKGETLAIVTLKGSDISLETKSKTLHSHGDTSV